MTPASKKAALLRLLARRWVTIPSDSAESTAWPSASSEG